MGLLNIFGGKDPAKQADKIKRRLTDIYRQTHERYEAMDQLARLGTPEALDALLARFTVRVQGSTIDEEEKLYAAERIAAWGEDAVPVLEAFIRSQNAIYFPLKALREIAGDDRAVELLLEVIADIDPGYHEGLERMREIVSNLRGFQHPRVREKLVELLDSPADDVRFYALDGLSTYPSNEVAGHFAERLSNPDESQRVKTAACELAIEHGMTFEAQAADVQKGLGQNYQLNEQFEIVRRV
jgi:HEAT repeat protein